MTDREWCCDRLEEHTATNYHRDRWKGRVVTENKDGELTLARTQQYEDCLGVRPIPFDYCPFCGSEVNHD